MNIKSTFIWTSIHTVIKILSGIIMNKVIAVYLGPSGLAMIGQFQNFVSLIASIANGSIQTGIVKYTAEYKENKEYLTRILKNSFIVTLSLSFLSSIVLVVFAKYFSIEIMFSDEYTNIIYFLGFSIVFYSLNLYLLSILNGLGKIKLFTIINIIISLFSLIIMSILTIQYKLKGALVAIILVQSLVFFISYILIYKRFGNRFFFSDIFNGVDKVIIVRLFKFSIATFSSGAIVSLMMISLRHMLSKEISIESAGLWEAAWRMMLYFNMFFTLPFSIYYLPKFSSSHKIEEIKSYLFESYRFILPLALLAGLLLFFLRHEIIILLFSLKFIKIESLIIYLLCGEILKILAFTLSNVFTAKAKIFTTILIQLVFASLLIFSSYVTIPKFGIIGMGYSYLIASIVFFTIYIYAFNTRLNNGPRFK
jgi:polysaccharide transporter, PST family